MSARQWLVVTLLALVVLFATWFAARGDTIAFVVFALPALAFAFAALKRRRTAGFWSGVFALLWFSHGVMVAWTRPDERGFALAEVALSLVVVAVASLPGLRARFGGRR